MTDNRQGDSSRSLPSALLAVALVSALFSCNVVAQLVPAAVNKSAVVRTLSESPLEVGQAWLLRSGERCLAIMPWHVIQESGQPSLLLEGGEVIGEATDAINLGSDVGVASVVGVAPRDCGVQLGAMSRAVDDLLARNPQVNIRTVLGDGTVSASPASVVDNDGEQFLRISPTSTRLPIRKGQSGSLIMVGDRVVGQLLSVSSRDGLGKVLRTDALLSRVSQHSSLRQIASSAGGASTSQSDWSVSAWNSAPMAASFSALNLTAESGLGWKTLPRTWPVSVELTSKEDVIRKIDSVSVFLPASQTSSRRSLRYQLLVSLTSAGNDWRSVTSGEISEGKENAISLSSIRALRIRFEFFPSQATGDELSAPVHLQRIVVSSSA